MAYTTNGRFPFSAFYGLWQHTHIPQSAVCLLFWFIDETVPATSPFCLFLLFTFRRVREVGRATGFNDNGLCDDGRRTFRKRAKN